MRFILNAITVIFVFKIEDIILIKLAIQLTWKPGVARLTAPTYDS